MQKKFQMSELTGGEAKEVYARRPTILVPIGSHEDQGPHAPMGDYMLADRLALAIAERAAAAGVESYLAPVLPFGGADYFGSTPGGIALSQSTLRKVLSDVFESLLRHRLTSIIVINGHGGNVQAVHDVTQEIYLRAGVMIPSIYPWRIAHGLLASWLGAEGAKQAVGHGADPLTSLAMYLSPEKMRSDLMPSPTAPSEFWGYPATLGAINFEGVEINVPMEIDEVAPTAVINGADPRLSSAERGKALFDKLTDIGVRFVSAHRRRWTALAAEVERKG
jgi:creatinine amidohydrolase